MAAPSPAKAPKRSTPAKSSLPPDAAAALAAAEAAADALPEVQEGDIEWFVEGMVHDDNPEPPLAGQKVGARAACRCPAQRAAGREHADPLGLLPLASGRDRRPRNLGAAARAPFWQRRGSRSQPRSRAPPHRRRCPAATTSACTTKPLCSAATCRACGERRRGTSFAGVAWGSGERTVAGALRLGCRRGAPYCHGRGACLYGTAEAWGARGAGPTRGGPPRQCPASRRGRATSTQRAAPCRVPARCPAAYPVPLAVRRHGGRVTGSVSGKTSFLVVGQHASKRKFKEVGGTG